MTFENYESFRDERRKLMTEKIENAYYGLWNEQNVAHSFDFEN